MRAKDRPLENDFVTDEAFAEMLLAWFGNIGRVLLPGHAAYIWGGYANVANYPPALKAAGLYFSQTIIWDKQHPVLTRKDFMGAHEWCFYCWKEGAAHRFFGPKNVPDLWPIKKVNPQSMIHLTEKPVELAARALAYSSKPGENVLDLFGGSGSTLIACEQANRHAFLMELDPAYCDVITTRWESSHGPEGRAGAVVIYLAAPYSHPDPAVREERYRQTCWHAVRLMREGRLVYSPIVHSHPLAQLGLPGDWPFWAEHNREMLGASSRLVVLALDGWQESQGVAAEVEIARELELPIQVEAPAGVACG